MTPLAVKASGTKQCIKVPKFEAQATAALIADFYNNIGHKRKKIGGKMHYVGLALRNARPDLKIVRAA